MTPTRVLLADDHRLFREGLRHICAAVGEFDVDRYPLGRHAQFLEDRAGKLTIGDITSPAVAARFVGSDKDIPNFGIGDTVYWIRFRAANHSTTARVWLLEQQFPLMRTFDLYTPDGTAAFQSPGSATISLISTNPCCTGIPFFPSAFRKMRIRSTSGPRWAASPATCRATSWTKTRWGRCSPT